MNIKKRFVELLSGAAMYNDKGYIWSKHKPAESEKLRAQWQAELSEILLQLEHLNPPQALIEAVDSGEAVTDPLGGYTAIACEWLKLDHPSKAIREKYIK